MKKTALLTTLTALFLVSQADAQSCMANVKKSGLTVGTSPDYPPYESLNEKNEIVGFDIDLINAVAKKMGVKVKVVGQGFDVDLAQLQAGFEVLHGGAQTAAAFGQRRKMLRQSLKGITPDPASLLAGVGIAETARAEEVPVEGFVALANALDDMRKAGPR